MVPVFWPQHAERGDPVAVVYYRCQLNPAKECTPRDDLYYVHNAVALEGLPAKDGGAKISHVPAWPVGQGEPTVDELYICGADRATQWAQGTVTDAPHCHVTGGTAGRHDTATWVVKAIYTYSVGEPIAWKVTTTSGGTTTVVDVHDGVFKGFQKPGTKPADADRDIRNIIPQTGGAATLQGGTLEFWHYVNSNPGGTSPGGTKENGRTAYKSWEKFTLQPGEVSVPAGGSITIKSRWG